MVPSLARLDSFPVELTVEGPAINVETIGDRFRIGIGHDTHRLGANRPLLIGGVVIPHSVGLVGHSDADVLLHALTDAILGAAGRGDIGDWFPDNDPANAGRDSTNMLDEVLRRALPAQSRIVNLDCTIFAERPKLGPHKRMIADRIAAILGIEPARVNVKAKTGEAVGPIGRGEAIGAEAIVLIELGPAPSNQ